MIIDIIASQRRQGTTKLKLSLKKNSQKVALLKTISWRVIGSLDTMLISYLITGNISAAIGISGVELVSKMGLYYFHERLWTKITK